MIYQIFYLSSSKINNEKEIDDLVYKSLSYNASKTISGILLFRSGIFLQLLEGDQQEVEKLFKKIETDSRHANLVVLFRQNTDRRIFPEWDMGLKILSDLDIKMVNEILSWNKLISSKKGDEIDHHLILHMLDRFKNKDLKKSA